MTEQALKIRTRAPLAPFKDSNRCTKKDNPEKNGMGRSFYIEVVRNEKANSKRGIEAWRNMSPEKRRKYEIASYVTMVCMTVIPVVAVGFAASAVDSAVEGISFAENTSTYEAVSTMETLAEAQYQFNGMRENRPTSDYATIAELKDYALIPFDFPDDGSVIVSVETVEGEERFEAHTKDQAGGVHSISSEDLSVTSSEG